MFAAIVKYGKDLEEVHLCPHTQEAADTIRAEVLDALKGRPAEVVQQAFSILSPAADSPPLSGTGTGDSMPLGPQDTLGPWPATYDAVGPDEAARKHGIQGTPRAWWTMIPRIPTQPSN